MIVQCEHFKNTLIWHDLLWYICMMRNSQHHFLSTVQKRNKPVSMKQNRCAIFTQIDPSQGYWLSVLYWSGLPCLVQLLIWLHVSDHKFWNTDRCKSESSLLLNNLFSYRNVLQNGFNALSKDGFKNSVFFFT